MYIKSEIRFMGELKCLFLDMSLSKWQSVLSDNVSLVRSADDKMILFSFVTGKHLCEIQMGPEAISAINDSEFLGLNIYDSAETDPAETLVIKKDRYDLTGQFIKGIRSQAAGNAAEAIDSYKQVISADPKVGRVYNLLGLCYRITGENEAAERCYLKSIELFPAAPEAYSNLGILMQKTRRAEKAEELFAKALELDGFYFNALLRQAGILEKRNEFGSQQMAQINYRLLALFSEMESVQNHLMYIAEKLQLDIQTYAQKLRELNGFFAEKNVPELMQRINSMVNNGACAAALIGMGIFLKRANEAGESDAAHSWCSSLLAIIDAKFANTKFFGFESQHASVQSALGLEQKQSPASSSSAPTPVSTPQPAPEPAPKPVSVPTPQLAPKSAPVATPQPASEPESRPAPEPEAASSDKPAKDPRSPLTAQEFFGQVLLEVMRDGQLDGSEKVLVEKLKQALSISEEVFGHLVKRIKAQLAGLKPEDMQSAGSFDKHRLFASLVRSALRDGQVDESEKKILVFASKAFGIASEDVNRIIAEVRK